MKLPRYISGRSNVAELQAARGAVRSPSEVANVQLAKFGAIGDVAGAVGDALLTVDNVRKKTQAAKDKVTFQNNENFLKSAYDQLQNDPNLSKPVQDDGSSTAEYFKRESAALMKTYKEGLGDIENPESRKIAEQLARNRELSMRTEINNDLGVIEARVAEGDFIGGMNESIRAGNTEGARELLTTGYDSGLVDAKSRETWTKAIEKADNQAQAQEQVEYINEGFSFSQEEGNKRLSETIRDKSLSTEVRDMAIDGGEEKASEWAKARDDETKAVEVEAILAFGNDSVRTDAGLMSYEQIDAAYSSGVYGDPKSTGAANRRNQLYRKITTAVGKKETELNIRESYESGRFMVDDKKHRDGLSEYEAEVTAEMDGAEKIDTIGEISRTLGTVSTNTSNTLNLSSKSEAALAQNLTLYRELTSDENVQPSLYVSAASSGMLESASTLMDAGLSQVESASIAYAKANPSELEKVEREQTWANVTVATANDSFESLVDSDVYEEPGFGNVDPPPAAMQVEYAAVYKAVFMQTGNEDAARNTANRAIRNNWVMTNFNSPDPDEYTIEKNGIPGDSRTIRKGVISEIDTQSYRIRRNDGTYKTSSIDPEKVTLTPLDRDEDGNRTYAVKQDGVPLFRVSDDGIEVVTYVLDESRIGEYQQKSATVETMEARLIDIKAEQKRLGKLVEQNPKIIIPGKMKKTKQRISGLAKEQQKLEQEIPAMRVKF